MKAFISLLLSLLLIVSLCGCSAKEAIASDKQEYIVASLGFDVKNEEIKMSIEAIVVNSDKLTSEEENENELIYAEGENIGEAFTKIVSQITQPLMFSHCAVVAVGSEITQNRLEEIFSFCTEKAKINLAAMFVYTKNAESLLSCKPRSSVAVGYDIMSMVEVVGEQRGLNFQNRFYEVENAQQKPMRTMYFPNMRVEDNEFSLEGLAVLKENEFVKMLDDRDTQVLGWLTDTVTSGESLVGGQEYKTEYSKTRYKFSYDDKLNITLNVRMTTTADLKVIKDEIEHRFNALRKGNGDIFGLGNKINHQAPNVWEKIKENYEESFRNVRLTVNVYER